MWSDVHAAAQSCYKKHFKRFNPHFIMSTEQPSSFDSKFAHGVEEVLPLLLLGAQTLLVLVEPAAQSSGLLGSQIQGLVLFTLEHIKQRFSQAEKHFIISNSRHVPAVAPC